MGKILVILGLLFVIAGLFVHYQIRLPFLGRMPGDISIQGEHFQFYFPIVTCIVISIILSLLFYLFSGRGS
jgi:hypothetical protein